MYGYTVQPQRAGLSFRDGNKLCNTFARAVVSPALCALGAYGWLNALKSLIGLVCIMCIIHRSTNHIIKVASPFGLTAEDAHSITLCHMPQTRCFLMSCLG